MLHFNKVTPSQPPPASLRSIVIAYVCFLSSNGTQGFYTRAFLGRGTILYQRRSLSLKSFSGDSHDFNNQFFHQVSSGKLSASGRGQRQRESIVVDAGEPVAPARQPRTDRRRRYDVKPAGTQQTRASPSRLDRESRKEPTSTRGRSATQRKPSGSTTKREFDTRKTTSFSSWNDKDIIKSMAKKTALGSRAAVEDAAKLVEELDADDLLSLVVDACEDEDVLAMAEKEFLRYEDNDPEGEEAIASLQRLFYRARTLEDEAQRARKPYKEIRELKALRIDLETELEMRRRDVFERRERRRKAVAEKAFYQALAASGYSMLESNSSSKSRSVNKKFSLPDIGKATAAATEAKTLISETTSQQLENLNVLLDPTPIQNMTNTEIAAHFVKTMGAATFLSGEAALNGAKAVVDGLFFSKEVSEETMAVINKLAVLFETARRKRREKAKKKRQERAEKELFFAQEKDYFMDPVKEETKKSKSTKRVMSPAARYFALKERFSEFVQGDTMQSAGDFVGSIGRTARVAVESVKGQDAAYFAADAAKKAREGWRKGVVAGCAMGKRSVQGIQNKTDTTVPVKPI